MYKLVIILFSCKNFYFLFDLFKPWNLPASKPCKCPVGDVEFDGHTNGGATDVSERN